MTAETSGGPGPRAAIGLVLGVLVVLGLGLWWVSSADGVDPQALDESASGDTVDGGPVVQRGGVAVIAAVWLGDGTWADAVLWGPDGEILEVGTEAEILAVVGSATEIVRRADATVVAAPGGVPNGSVAVMVGTPADLALVAAAPESLSVATIADTEVLAVIDAGATVSGDLAG